MTNISHQSMRPPAPSVESSLTGIVHFVVETEMARNDPDVHVVAAQTADIRSYGLPHKTSSDGSGAGLTYQAAYGAAVGECVERYACGVIHPEDLVFGSYRVLHNRGYNLVAPEQWALYHPNQHDQIPFAPFDADTPLAWTRAYSFTHRCERLVPACLVYMPYEPPFADQGEQEIAHAISTGMACARSGPEAVLKGMCELIERDTFMIMWRNQLACPRVEIDPQSALYPVFAEKFARPGLHYTLVQTTLDLQIPSFCGILRDTRRDPPAIVVGGATHPDPERAAMKTLLELVQGIKWLDHMGHQPIEPGPAFANIRSFEDRVRLYGFSDMRHALSFVLDSDHTVPLSSIPALPHPNDTRTVLRHCLNQLVSQGMEVLATDITPVDAAMCGYRIVKVLIPECEPMEADYLLPFLGGKRWQQVPYRLGLRTTPPDVIQNPYPHPYP